MTGIGRDHRGLPRGWMGGDVAGGSDVDDADREGSNQTPAPTMVELLGRCHGENERLVMALREILKTAVHAQSHSTLSPVIALALQIATLAKDGLAEAS